MNLTYCERDHQRRWSATMRERFGNFAGPSRERCGSGAGGAHQENALIHLEDVARADDNAVQEERGVASEVSLRTSGVCAQADG